MSQSTDGDGDQEGEIRPQSDPDEWESLSREEQDALLASQMGDAPGGAVTPGPPEDQDRDGDGDLESQVQDQEEDVTPEEAESAIALINQAMEETWTAEVLSNKEVGPIPVECYEPAESQIQEIKEFTRLYIQVREMDDVDDLDQEVLDQLDEADVKLNTLLGGDPEAEEGSPLRRGLVAEDGMDLSYFEDSSNYPSQLRLELFGAIYGRYREQMGMVNQFRTE